MGPLKLLIPFSLAIISFFSTCQKEEIIPNSQRHFYSDPTEIPDKRLRITAVGDIMFHHTQLYKAWVPEEQIFDFYPSFKQVENYLSEADITIGNLETTMSGPMGALIYDRETHVRGYQAYPTFNSPSTVADSLKRAGFDVILTSNNHSMDSGIKGMDLTLEELHRVGLLPVGTSNNSQADVLKITTQGMDLQIINWAYGTNGISIPEEELNRINSLQNYKNQRIETMLDQIREADRSGCDWVIMTIHFGVEYQTEPNQRLQRNLVDRMIDAGADIILGSHPHVLQPMEIRQRELANGQKENVFVIYSLGNFLASQPWRAHRPWETDNSIILNLDLAIDSQGNKRIDAIEFIPVYTQWTAHEIRVIPVEKALTDRGKQLWGYSSEDASRLPYIQGYVPSHMMKYMDGYNIEQINERFRIKIPKELHHEVAAD